MKSSNALVPQIQNQKDKNLSKLQKDFNSKIRKIAELKERIEDVKKQAETIKQKLQTEIIPLEREVADKRVEYVKQLDWVCQNYKLSKTERNTLTELLLGESLDLINVFNKTELIELYDRYNWDGLTYAQEEAEMKEQAKKQAENMFKQAFGKKVDLGDMEDEQAIFEKLHQAKAEMEEKMQQEAWESQQKAQKRKKTPKQEAAELKRQTEAEQLNKTARTIYTELVKELHPDREQDEEKRVWKTEIMKEVTQAYEKNDLFELLRLQLEYRQLETNLNEVPEESLSFYVKLLKDQVRELDNQLYQMTSPFMGVDSRLVELGLGGTENQVEYRVRQAKKELRDQMKSLDYTFRDIFKDVKKTKDYLKQHAKTNKYTEEIDLNELFSLFGKM